MSDIKKMREDLSLSQSDLAIFLGVSKSFLNKVEKGDKSLSIKCINKLLLLHEYAQQNNRHLVNTELVQQQNDLNIFFEKKSADNEFYKKQLIRKLKEDKDNYNAALFVLQMIRTLKNNLPKTATKDLLWCNAIEATAMQNLNKNSLVSQKQLELKIESL